MTIVIYIWIPYIEHTTNHTIINGGFLNNGGNLLSSNLLNGKLCIVSIHKNLIVYKELDFLYITIIVIPITVIYITIKYMW